MKHEAPLVGLSTLQVDDLPYENSVSLVGQKGAMQKTYGSAGFRKGSGASGVLEGASSADTSGTASVTKAHSSTRTSVHARDTVYKEKEFYPFYRQGLGAAAAATADFSNTISVKLADEKHAMGGAVRQLRPIPPGERSDGRRGEAKIAKNCPRL